MTDQVNTPEAGAQSQETTAEVDNQTTLEQMQQEEQQEPQEQQLVEEKAQKVVPLAALHEERARVKELRERQRVMEERFSQLQMTVTQRLTPQQQEQKQEIQIPDVNQDPVGHFRAENEALKRQLQDLGRPVQEIQQRMQQQEQYQRVQMHVRSQVNEFAKEKPDVAEAINHAQQADFQALKALGYDDAAAQQMVIQQYDNLVVGLIQQGRNVAEGMYALAQSKGFQPKAQATAQDKLQSTQRVNQAARSLGNGGGVANKLSLAALAEMPADEFAKTIGDDAAWRKLWGG